ncbi:transposon TX1 uncharacterized, partial [Tanacetum coccineum]
MPGLKISKVNPSIQGSEDKIITNINSRPDVVEGITEGNEDKEDKVYENARTNREKGEVSPSSSVGSRGYKLKKKRKANEGKRNVTKANEVARRMGVQGLGGNKKGIPDVYKEYYDRKSECNGVFHFGASNEGEVASTKCIVNLEQVKEIGELVGVSWVLAEEKKKEGMHEDERRTLERNEGYGGQWEKEWIRSVIKAKQPDVIGLQETKSGVIDATWIEDLWGDSGYGYSQLHAVGNSGGILVIWDLRVFTCKKAIGGERFIAVKGSWKGKIEEVFLVCIYGPHVSRQKMSLWDRLSSLMNRWDGAWCIFGDLNVVRSTDDRFNSQVNIKDMNEFNDFINERRLVEFNNLWGNLSVIALDRKLSDHCPIVLKDVDLDFGPKPFRVFNVWLEEPDFYHVVEEAWKKEVRGIWPDCIFRDRLKKVKASLRVWSKERFGENKEKIKSLRSETMRWKMEEEKRTLSDSERLAWLEVRKRWQEKGREYCNMLRQKNRVKWDMEGDENSKNFHSFVKRRNNKCNLRGLMVDGVWCEDPKVIKAEMARHYKKLFTEGMATHPIFCNNKIEQISREYASMLEKPFEEKEVWDAITGCGGDKAPRPDGFNFKFIQKVLEIIKPELIGATEWFWDKMEISRGCNASFVTIIPKGETSGGGGPKRIYKREIYSQLGSNSKRDDGIFEENKKKMGFGNKWCKWVDSCLRSSSMSILVNGSLSEEFGLERGVRQGDPLSPFLFILATEGLNAIVNEAVQKGIFRGVTVGKNNVLVSHLQYADDTIFFGEWNKENAKALMCILKCFKVVFGLRVNYNKSKIYGIGINDEKMSDMVTWMGCDIGEFPFTYLGLPIGENMRR